MTERLVQVADRLVTGRRWYVRAGVVTALLSFIVQTPAFVYHDFYSSIRNQALHPLTQAVSPRGSHEGKLAFRLVPPVLIHFLHLTEATYLLLQATVGIVALCALLWVIHRAGYSRRAALVVVLAIAFTYMGSVWFVDWQPYFDALAVAALVFAMAATQPLLVFAAISVAVWTDERAILAAVVVAVFHFDRDKRGAAAGVLGALAGYAVLRLWLGHHYGLHSDSGEIGPAVLHHYFSTMPIALTTALEGLWAVVTIGLIAGVLNRRPYAWVVALAAGASAVVSIMVGDVTRSTVYLLPAVVMAAVYLLDERKELRTAIIGTSFVVCLVVPTTVVVVQSFSILYPLPLRLVGG